MVANGKRLTFLLEHYWRQCKGGAELQAYYLEHEALHQELTTHYCFLSNGDYLDKIHNTIICPIPKKKMWSKLGNIQYPYALNVFQVLKKIKPDIIYQRCASALTGIAAYYAQKHNCQLTFHIASDSDVSQIFTPWKRPWLIPEYRLIQYGIINADVIVAQTQFQAQQLQQNYGRHAVVIPNGHPIPDDCVKLADQVTLVWIANWKQIKQPEVFVRLAREIGKEERLRFVMVGRTDGFNGLVELAKKNNIEVMGEISNDKVNDLLAQSHILVNTSKQEGFSNTFIQAWMRRVPVVSLRVDPDSILQNKQLGYCASGNFNELVLKTGRLISDHSLRHTIGERARKYAINHFSLKNINTILDVITNSGKHLK